MIPCILQYRRYDQYLYNELDAIRLGWTITDYMDRYCTSHPQLHLVRIVHYFYWCFHLPYFFFLNFSTSPKLTYVFSWSIICSHDMPNSVHLCLLILTLWNTVVLILSRAKWLALAVHGTLSSTSDVYYKNILFLSFLVFSFPKCTHHHRGNHCFNYLALCYWSIFIFHDFIAFSQK